MVSKVVFLCDGPDHDIPGGSEAQGMTRRFVLPGLSGNGVRELELCDPCMKKWTADLYSMLDEHARHGSPDKRPAQTEVRQPGHSYKCLHTNCPTSTTGGQSLLNHYVRAHGVLKGTSLMPDDLKACPLCGIPLTSPSGVGHHVGQIHLDEPGARSAYEAIVIAAELYGDEYGVASTVVKHYNSRGGKVKLRRHP